MAHIIMDHRVSGCFGTRKCETGLTRAKSPPHTFPLTYFRKNRTQNENIPNVGFFRQFMPYEGHGGQNDACEYSA